MTGKTINGYKLISYINQGGMAEVWYAEIYTRHGYLFQTSDMKKYFGAQE